MRESEVLNKRKDIVSELKELIELYKHGDYIHLSSEKVDLSKYKQLIKELNFGFKVSTVRDRINIRP